MQGDETIRPFAVTHRLVLSIAVPMTLGFLTVPLIGLADTAVAGRLGDATILAGLALGAVLFDLVFTTFNFLRSSTTGLVAQAFGRHDPREEQAVFFRALLSAAICSALLLLLAPLILILGLKAMAPDAATAAAIATYFKIRILSGPAAMVNFAVLGYLLGRGQGGAGLMLQTLINGANVILSVLFGLVLEYGLAGIALGTVTAEYLGALVGLLYVLRRFQPQDRPARADILDIGRLKALFALNGDILVRSFVLIAGYTLVARVGAGLGTVTLAANAVLMNLAMLSAFFLDGLANAAEQLTGRAIGARYRPAFDRGLLLTFGWSMAMAVGAALLFLLTGDRIVDLLTTVPEVRALAHEHVALAALCSVTGMLAFLMDGVVIGATRSRDMRPRMLASFLGFLLALAVLVPALGNTGLWLAFNIFLGLRGILLALILPARRRQTFFAAQ